MAKNIKCPICGNKPEGETCPDCATSAPGKQRSGKMKLISLALISVLLLSVTACSGNDSSDKSSTSTETSAETAAATEAASEETETATEAATEAAAETEAAEFEEISLLESDDYIVKITDITDGILTDYGWKLYVENKTDKNVTVTFNDVSVDGAMNDPFWALEVAAGKNGYSDVEWYTLSDFGITDPTIIEGTLNIYDSDTWDEYYNEPFTVTPLGEDKVQTVTRTPQDTDNVLIDNDYVTVSQISFSASSEYADMGLYIESKTDNPIMVSIEDCAINDTMCDPFWACSLGGNKVACSTVSWSSATLEESNLTVDDVKDITFTLQVYNNETLDYYAQESISLTVE